MKIRCGAGHRGPARPSPAQCPFHQQGIPSADLDQEAPGNARRAVGLGPCSHRHEVIHRNLTPDAILVTKGGQARVTGFDFARVGKNRTTTIADQVVDDHPGKPPTRLRSVSQGPDQASISSDLTPPG